MLPKLYIEKLRELQKEIKKNPELALVYKDIHINYFIWRIEQLVYESKRIALDYEVVSIPDCKINRYPQAIQDKLIGKYLFPDIN